ncbi:MAG: hypothetical protein WBF58_18980 [Xanthobacteraceae bacterium]
MRTKRNVLAAAAVLAAVAAVAAMPALAQAPKPVRLSGAIGTVDGRTVTATSEKGAALTIKLTDKAVVVRAVKASLADIKPGDFIGSGAMPQPDGTQRAVEVHIFPEAMRGTGEGFRPWIHPGSTMTNGTVGEIVTGVSGQVITVKYKGGEQKIVVPPGTPIVKFEIAGLSALTPGAHFSVIAAIAQPDGSYEASRVTVGP